MNEDELAKAIPKTAKEFRFANSLIKITKTNGEPSGMIFKNTEEEDDKHFHFYTKDDQVFLHETIENNKKNLHNPINIQEMLEILGKGLQKMFSLAKQVELTDEEFLGKKVVLGSKFDMAVEKSTKKKVKFVQDYNLDETVFENINVEKNSVGSIWEDDNETHMIFVKDRLVYVIDLEELDKLETDLDDSMKPSEKSG